MPKKMLYLPVIPLRGLTILPGTTVHFDISRKQSIAAAEEAMTRGQNLFVTAQKDPMEETPGFNDIYKIGTVVVVKQINKMPDHVLRVMVEAKCKAEIMEFTNEEPYLEGKILEKNVTNEQILENERIAYLRDLKQEVVFYDKSSNELTPSGIKTLKTQDDLDKLMLQIMMRIKVDFRTKQKFLEADSTFEKYSIIAAFLRKENEITSIKSEILDKVKAKLEKNQREHILREQIKVIREELGETDLESEIDEFLERAEALNADEEIKEHLIKEIQRLRSAGPNTADSNVLRNYIETMFEMPWNNKAEECDDINVAAEILDRDHYGLKKVKERVIEFLAVRILTKEKGESPIVCLAGPPGTGKTSIARSVAEALNKQYVRICLGGLSDESEIRGHRKTYVGAMPGRIATGIKQAGISNPLILLDEIDKLGQSNHGDPSAALLEVLDSEQNSKFRDNYLQVPLDLSGVLFIATANDLSTIQKPLLDRMEVIEISSYTENEKFHIAKEHLINKQLEKNGLKRSQVMISDEAINKMIKNYTREAGVRKLDRNIAKICRKAAKELIQNEKKIVKITSKNIEKYLGKPIYRDEEANRKDEIGIVRGLAWTSVGGATLQIEVNTMPGKGEIKLTGQLGDVMKESAQIALSYVRSIAGNYGIDKAFFKENDIHMHIPEGAVPKDGPSAGITMATALLSAIAEIPVYRKVAMTGEINLRGKAMPIGGLKEKLLAAKNAGMEKVLVPLKNQADVEELESEIVEGLNIVFVDDMKQVLEEALVK